MNQILDILLKICKQSGSQPLFKCAKFGCVFFGGFVSLVDRWPGDKAVVSVKIPIIWEVGVWYYQEVRGLKLKTLTVHWCRQAVRS